jgi:hypothetical protein
MFGPMEGLNYSLCVRKERYADNPLHNGGIVKIITIAGFPPARCSFDTSIKVRN